MQETETDCLVATEWPNDHILVESAQVMEDARGIRRKSNGYVILDR